MAKKDKKPDKVEKTKAPKAEKPGKEKKNKKKGADAAASTGANPATPSKPDASGAASIPLANMSPEQMTAAQIEQAIKESNDPNSRLKKLRNPFNVRSCLLNVLILIVATFAIVILWSFLVVDKFNFVTVMSDMFSKFGITDFFTNIGRTISGWFK